MDYPRSNVRPRLASPAPRVGKRGHRFERYSPVDPVDDLVSRI